MRWALSHRFDREVLPLADRHYNRQTPGSPQFVPPGRCLVLRAGAPVKAFWVTSWPFAEYTKHDWAGAWVCSAFRNEGGVGLSSELIREAVAATVGRWPEVPELGMITFVDSSKVKAGKPGYCYQMAGFRHVGYTKERRLHAWQLLPVDMPDAVVLGQQGLFSSHQGAGLSGKYNEERT